MKAVCAWCNKVLKEIDDGDDVITHGMCKACAESFTSKLGQSLTQFLNRLDAPVVLVNSNAEVITCNDQASALLDKERRDIDGYLAGDVIECAHARLLKGCGNTIHCKACTLRLSVDETYKTGKSIENREALMNQATPDGENKVAFLISTQKVNDYVLLRIDDVREVDEETD
jgi:transcriptional regulator with PAS, ATPase and Fis domain